MSCSGCGGSSTFRTVPVIPTGVVKNTTSEVIGKSADTKVRVPLRYYGGGLTSKKVATCAPCGSGKGSYARMTNELIEFASDDEPNGMFRQFMEAGRTYYVTEKQAEYLLALTYINQAGQEVHKFKRVEG